MLHGRKSKKTVETKGKFYKLKVNKREFERKDTNTLRESQRKWEKVRENWEKVREYGRKSEKTGETKRIFYKLKVNKREFERKDTNTSGESQRK